MLREDLRRGWRWLRKGETVEHQSDFWALRDVSFTVQPGEVLGIMGRNGAGKSTLLKILSRITEPTSGRAVLRGRVASLLEVGTGFHPDLTGRENVYLNGAILGMKNTEIASRFDEIVAFAEVERFIDTPVKHYSSGMRVRLAFAVAAHLDSEILIADEVLAVGDSTFQAKSLQKMQSVAKSEGRTILFVSHSLNMIQRLCRTGLMLNNGTVVASDGIDAVLQHYANVGTLQNRTTFPVAPDKPSITAISVDEQELHAGHLSIDISFESPVPLDPPVPGIVLHSLHGNPVYGSNTRSHRPATPLSPARHGTLRITVPDLPLAPGEYYVSAWLGDAGGDHDERLHALRFRFEGRLHGDRGPRIGELGVIDLPGRWTTTG